MKFKVGDRVRMIAPGNPEVGTVVKANPKPTSPTYEVKLDAYPHPWFIHEPDLELDSASYPLLVAGAVGGLGSGPSHSTGYYLAQSAKPAQQQHDDAIRNAFFGGSEYTSKETRAARKAEGKCEECGDLLPMSVHGLGECAKHPKQTGETKW